MTQVIQIHVYIQTVETAHTKYIIMYVCYDKYHFSLKSPHFSLKSPHFSLKSPHFSQKFHPSESPDVSASLSFLVVYIFIQTPLHAPVIANYLNMGTRRKANWTPAELNILVSRVTDNIHIVRASISGPGAAERTKFWADLCER